MGEEYQVHAALQILSLLSLVGAAFSARKHKLKLHHTFVSGSLILSTLAVALMINLTRGLPILHCQLGISVYILILITASTGGLFLKRKLTRNQHKALALSTIVFLLLMILHGLATFVF